MMMFFRKHDDAFFSTPAVLFEAENALAFEEEAGGAFLRSQSGGRRNQPSFFDRADRASPAGRSCLESERTHPFSVRFCLFTAEIRPFVNEV